MTLEARFREGEGLSGRAWKARDLVFVPDLGQVRDCCRAPVAQRAGVKSGVCLPIMMSGKVIGTMDFFATETLDLIKSGWRRCATSADWSPARSKRLRRQEGMAEMSRDSTGHPEPGKRALPADR